MIKANVGSVGKQFKYPVITSYVRNNHFIRLVNSRNPSQPLRTNMNWQNLTLDSIMNPLKIFTLPQILNSKNLIVSIVMWFGAINRSKFYKFWIVSCVLWEANESFLKLMLPLVALVHGTLMLIFFQAIGFASMP